ncbi:MAG: flagellar protein FlaG, partial [Pseudomonadota bacterium]
MNELNSQETTRISTTLGTSRAQARSGQDATRSSQAPADSAQSGNPLPGRGEALPSTEASARGGAVDEAVVALNDYVQSVERNIRFTFDDDLGRSIVSVVDSETE